MQNQSYDHSYAEEAYDYDAERDAQSNRSNILWTSLEERTISCGYKLQMISRLLYLSILGEMCNIEMS